MKVIRSLFGESKPRIGKLTLTEKASRKMHMAGMDTSTLYDVYRYGYEIRDNMIIRDYTRYIVGIVIKPDESTKIGGRFLVLTCWKRDCG